MKQVQNQKFRFFVDANILVGAVREEENNHKDAAEFFKVVKRNNGIIMTNSLVITEVLTTLFKKNLSLEIIKDFQDRLLNSEDFMIINVADSQILKVISKIIEHCIKLKTSDLYHAATAIYFDTIFLTLDDQIFKNVSGIYENTFNDPKHLAEFLKG